MVPVYIGKQHWTSNRLQCKSVVVNTWWAYSIHTLSLFVQVCAHIVQAIRKETIRVREVWESRLENGKQQPAADDMEKYVHVNCLFV